MSLDLVPATPAEHGLPDGVWNVDAQRSEVSFAVKEMWGLRTVRGVFTWVDGNLKVQGDDAAGALTIDAESVDTGNARRDEHLRSADFFDVDQHPQIVFTARGVTSHDGRLTIAGYLAIGASRTRLEIPLAVEQLPDGAMRLVGETTVSRKAVGLGWNKLAMIRDDTLLHAHVTLVRAP